MILRKPQYSSDHLKAAEIALLGWEICIPLVDFQPLCRRGKAHVLSIPPVTLYTLVLTTNRGSEM